MPDSLDAIAETPGALPVVGHGIALVRNPLGFLLSLLDRGEIVKIRIGPAKVLVVCHPALAWQVLRDGRTFDKGGPIMERAREFAGNGLVTCAYEDHRRQRIKVQPAFHPSRMSGYAQIAAAQIAAVTSAWRHGQIIGVLQEMMTATSMSVLEAMMSNALPPTVVRQCARDWETVISGAYRRMLIPPPLDRLPTPGNLRYRQANRRLRETVNNVIAERRATPHDRGDLLSALVTPDHTDSPGELRDLSDAEISDQVLTFLAGGTETVAAALSWSLHLLGQHPEIDARLRKEVDAATPGNLDISRLEFTGRVLTEALRLYPPAWMLTRTVTRDTTLNEYPIPAGTTIVCSPYMLHHSSSVFHEPERFDPDRWLPERCGSVPRGGFVPFGAGARKCIGDDFGFTEAVLALAAIKARWDLTPTSSDVRPSIGMSLRPRNLTMLVTERRT